MSLANLFIELVVTGFHALFWIGLFITAFAGYQQIDLEKLVAVNLAVPFLAITYILGIVIDKFADSVFMVQDHRIRDRYKPRDLPSLLTMRFYVLSKSNEMYEQLEYIRSRMRIARAAVVNFILTTVAALTFVGLQLNGRISPEYRILVYLVILSVGAILCFSSYRAWIALTKTYISSAIAAYKVLQAEKSKSKTGGSGASENDID